MLTEEERAVRRERCRRLTIYAREYLRPGDRLRVKMCAGRQRTLTWTGRWESEWLICRPSLREHLWSLWHFRELAVPIDDVHASHIIAVNGRHVRFDEAGAVFGKGEV